MNEDVAEDQIKVIQDKLETISSDKKKRYGRFVLAALSSIPWIGGLISGMAGISAEKDQGKTNQLQQEWLEEHTKKLNELGVTLMEIFARLDDFGDEVRERIESPSYLDLIRKGFRSWDQADTQEKRDLIKKLLMNAGATKICPDDLIRLFIDWIDTYHESHFKVMREIYKNRGITRGGIWDNIHGTRPRENAAEADLFKLLIRDLSMGSVIHQHRETNAYGEFVPKTRTTRSRSRDSDTMKSAFDDIEPYELTELGSQFVHYTMSDVVTRIEKQ